MKQLRNNRGHGAPDFGKLIIPAIITAPIWVPCLIIYKSVKCIKRKINKVWVKNERD